MSHAGWELSTRGQSMNISLKWDETGPFTLILHFLFCVIQELVFVKDMEDHMKNYVNWRSRNLISRTKCKGVISLFFFFTFSILKTSHFLLHWIIILSHLGKTPLRNLKFQYLLNLLKLFIQVIELFRSSNQWISTISSLISSFFFLFWKSEPSSSPLNSIPV